MARRTTGFMDWEYGLAVKWPELLKQIAPNVTRVAVLRDPTIPTGPAQFGAPSLWMDVVPFNVRDVPEIERAIAAFARAPNGGLITTAGGCRSLKQHPPANWRVAEIYWEFINRCGAILRAVVRS